MNWMQQMKKMSKEKVIRQNTKMTIEIFRYQDTQASTYCKLPKPYIDSKSIENVQNDGNYCFLWCISVQSQDVDIRCQNLSQYREIFYRT